LRPKQRPMASVFDLEAKLLQRDRYLEGLVRMQSRLLATRSDGLGAVNEALAPLGEASGADRVYVFENDRQDGEWMGTTSQRAEWCAIGIEPQLDNPDLQGIDLRGLFPLWWETLGRGDAVVRLERDFDEMERAVLGPQSVRSLLVLPLMVDEEWTGFIGFDNCRAEAEWSSAEVTLLQTAASQISLNLQQRRARRELEELNASLEARVVSRTAELADKNAALRDALGSLAALNADLEARVASRTEALRESEERFRRLFEAAPEALLMLDDTGRVRQCNRMAAEVFGGPLTALQGADVARLIALEARSLDQLVSAPLGRAELDGLRLDGRAFAAEVALAAIEVDGRPHTLASVKDISERRAAARALQASLSEKDTLLREIHHRVKNNLQIVSSLLMLQSEQLASQEARDQLGESVNRVRSMALIHQQLYSVDSLARIDLGVYARALCQSLAATLAPTAKVEVETAGLVEVSVEQAVPVGLILNELFTNACKYGLRRGAPEGQSFDVRIRLEGDDCALGLIVEDRGLGLPPGLELETSRSLGLVLVRNLARQLRGRALLESRGGTRATVRWPRTPGKEALRGTED
jgi:PAS domain S-box-containing protein